MKFRKSGLYCKPLAFSISLIVGVDVQCAEYNFITIGSGQSLSLYSGDTSYSLNIENDGEENVYDGGVSTITNINNGGRQNIFNGGYSYYSDINSGGKLTVNNGGFNFYGNVKDDGLILIDGGTGSSNTILSGGEINVMNGGSVFYSTVSDGAKLEILDSGFGSYNTVYAGGVIDVDSGGSTGDVLKNGGKINVTNGGEIFYTTVEGNVDLTESTGSYLDIENTGIVTATSNSVVKGSNIHDGGLLIIKDNSSTTDAVVNNDGVIDVYDSGSAINTSISNGGILNVNYGGESSSSLVGNGGVENIFLGATSDSSIINTGGIQQIYGSTLNGLITEGGISNVYQGGVANKYQVNNLGVLNIFDGGESTNAVVLSGGVENVNGGVSSNSSIYSGGVQNVSNSGVTFNEIINESAVVNLMEGGIGNNAVINKGGTENVLSGGKSIGSLIQDGGVQKIFSGGDSASPTILSGGQLIANSNSTASNIQQDEYGALITDTSTTLSGVNKYGDFSVNNGIAENILVENGGVFTVLGNNTASDTTVSAGGQLNLNDESIITGATKIYDNTVFNAEDFYNNGDLDFITDIDRSWEGTINGSGNISKNGTGVLTLSGQINQSGLLAYEGTLILDDVNTKLDLGGSSEGTIELKNNSNLTGGSNLVSLTVDSGSTWSVTKDSSLSNLLLNGSVIFLQNNDDLAYSSLTVSNLYGDAGSIFINSYLEGNDSLTNKLIINGGQSTGLTNVYVKNLGGLGAQTEGLGIEIIEAINGATTSPTSFKLGNEVIAGAYKYSLYRNQNENWYLTSKVLIDNTSTPSDNNNAPVIVTDTENYRDAIWSYKALNNNLFNYDSMLLSSYDTRYQNKRDGFWGRIISGNFENAHVNAVSSVNTPKTKADYQFVQMGKDLLTASSGSNTFNSGLFLDVGGFDANAFSEAGLSGKTNSKSYGLGVYLNGSVNNFYFDGVAQVSNYDNKIISNDGTNLKNSSISWSLSLESGYTFSLMNLVNVTPQAQFIVQGLKIKDSSDQVAEMNWTSVPKKTTRVGFKFSKSNIVNEENYDKYTFWVRPSVQNTFGGKSKLNVSSQGDAITATDFTTDYNGSSLMLDGGIDYNINNNVGLGLKVGYSKSLGQNGTGGRYGQVGFNIRF